jgi:hypothetical protein
MRLSVLGGCGAWPAAGQACSGYLVEQDGFRLLVGHGYATLPRLLELLSADDVNARTSCPNGGRAGACLHRGHWAEPGCG